MASAGFRHQRSCCRAAIAAHVNKIIHTRCERYECVAVSREHGTMQQNMFDPMPVLQSLGLGLWGAYQPGTSPPNTVTGPTHSPHGMDRQGGPTFDSCADRRGACRTDECKSFQGPDLRISMGTQLDHNYSRALQRVFWALQEL